MNEKRWCPACGKWSDHRSAQCLFAPSAQAPVESQRASQLVGSDAVVRLRSLTFICVAQAGMALVLGALGTVDRHTVIPACYFSFTIFVGVWLMREKPNNEGSRAP